MPDYNIYIHSVENVGGNASATTPWSTDPKSAAYRGSQTQAWQGTSKGEFQSGETPDMNVGKGTTALAKSSPNVAIAAAIVAAGIKAYDMTVNATASVSGWNEQKRAWENMKTAVQNLINPTGLAMKAYDIGITDSVEEGRKRAKLELLGDSAINVISKGI